MSALFDKFTLRVVAAVGTLLCALLCTRQAYAQYYEHPYVEAECPISHTGAYGSTLTSLSGFSGPGFLRSQGNTTANSFNNSSTDRATYELSTPEATWYKIWFRVNTNGSGGDDSFYYKLDLDTGATPFWVTINNLPQTTSWQWISDGTAYPSGASTLSLEIANRENGISIDKIAALPLSESPSGVGAAAYNCPVTLYFESECRKGAFASYQFERSSKGGYSGSGYLESSTDNLNPNTRLDEATYFFEAANSSYDFHFRVHNNGSYDDDSWYYRIDGGSWVTMNNTVGNGWRWVRGTSSATLSRGVHTLQVRNRESGLSLDKIAFVPSGFTAPSGAGAGGISTNCEPFQTMADWRYREIQEYAQSHYEYWIHSGDHHLQHHYDWHIRNGQGGIAYNPNTGEPIIGCGTAFLGFHRAMMNDLRQFALETNGRPPLPVSVIGPVIPSTLPEAFTVLNAIGRLDVYSPRDNSYVSDIGVPQQLTLAGGLANFTNLDALGRSIGATYHIFVHSAIGGTMGSNYSPADPIFYGWHGQIDSIVDQWLGTPNGQAWVASHPGHAFLEEGFTQMHGWENGDFPND